MVIRIWSKKGALFPPTPPAVMKNYMTTIDNRFGISYKLNIHTYTYIYIISIYMKLKVDKPLVSTLSSFY